ncbi:DUF2142 domain-containing protein [Marvinbryantia formatexigens]|uniref:DUF2142 domain-containing protein n=1 Tax=Marvinbryantia formatexigens TaxID=168384 RepID=UPI001A9A445E|nr:DUF2142 domain-containing protein [Marvinbryantia formatexigens]
MIVVAFIWQIFTSGTQTFQQYSLGTSSDEEYEILDGQRLDTVFRIGQDNPDGFIIYNYKKNNLSFTDEKLLISLFNEEDGALIQKNEIELANQFGNFYISFQEELPAGTKVRLRIESEGLEEKGPTISLSEESGYGSALWEDGVLQETYLCGALCYKTISYNYLKAVLYLAAEILTGILLFLARKKLHLPVWNEKKTERIVKRRINWKRTCLGAVIIFAGGLILADYIYTYCIEKLVAERQYEVACRDGQQWIGMGEGDEVSQIFCVSGDDFSGIGIGIEADEDTKATLRLELYDFTTGELLLEKEYRVSALTELSDVIPKREIEADDTEMTEQYVFFDWQTVLEDSANHYYKVILRSGNLQEEELKLAVGTGRNFSLMKNGENASGNLAITALYSKNLFLEKMFRCLMIAVIVFGTGLWIFVSVFRVPAAKMYAVSALVLGMIFCFLIPPYCVPDEWTHFDSAYRISNEMLGITEIPGPDRIYKRACDINEKVGSTMKVDLEEYRDFYEELQETSEDETLTIAYAGNAVNNVTVLNYLPSAIGFTVARILHLGHAVMLLMGRICNLLVTILLMYVAIRKVPFGKSVLAVVGLVPIMLQQMASCSYDGIIIGAANIFIAYCLHIIFEKDVSISDLLVIAVSGAMMAVCKGGVYIPVLGLLLLAVFSGKKLDWKRLAGVFGMLFSMGILFIAQFSERIISMFSKAQGTSFRSGDVELYTISYFLEHPKQLIRLYQNTVTERLDYYIQGMAGGRLGNLEIVLPWFLVIAFLLIICICTVRSEKEQVFWNKWQRGLVVLLCLGSMVLTQLSMLLAWTEVGTQSIDGVQGRYFLPFAGLLFVVFRNKTFSFKNKRDDLLIFSAALLDMIAIGYVVVSIF